MMRITHAFGRSALPALAGAAASAVLLMSAPAHAQEPVVRQACYVPGTGTVYLIGEPGTKKTCTAKSHVPFSWTDGAGALRAGDVAGGDLAGTLPAPAVQALQGRAVSAAAPAANEVLTWNDAAARWEPKAVQGGGTATDHGALTGLGDDDHPQYLLLDGHRHATGGGFAVSGTFGVGNVPVTGAGGRLMYATTANAFRVGSVSAPFADGWDLPNLGIGSAAIGHNVRAMSQNSIVLGSNVHAVPAASGSIVIGVNSEPFTLIGPTVPRQVYVYGENGIVMRTAGLASTCELLPGSGAWQCSSDAAGKSDFAEVDPETVLQRVASLPITRWRYSGEPDSVRHIGPTAQDFRAAFGLGAGDRHIGVLDASGVGLAASKALAARTDALAADNAELRAEVSTLRGDVAGLRSELDRLRDAYTDMLSRLAAVEAAQRN